MCQRLGAFLVLGCNGSGVSKDFVFCHGVKSPIIDLSSLDKEKYLELLDFLDNACNLFDSVMLDYNKCVNTISFLHKKFDLYDQKTLNRIQTFIKMHKDCGIFLTLVLKEDYSNE